MDMQIRFSNSQGEPMSGGVPPVILSTGALSVGATLTVGAREYDVVSSSFALDKGVLSNEVVLREVKRSFVADLSQDSKQWVGTVMFIGSIVLLLFGYALYVRDREWFDGAVGAGLRWGIPVAIIGAGMTISNLIDKTYLKKRPSFWGLYLYFVFAWGGVWIAFFWAAFFAPPQSLEVFPADYANYVTYFRNVFDPIQPVLAAILGWLSLALGFIGLESFGKLLGAIKGKS
jgi:hypothetical protein